MATAASDCDCGDQVTEQKNAPELPIGRFLQSKSLGGNRVISNVILLGSNMKHALIGNGVAIQFGGTAYLNGNIIQRAIENVRSGNFPSELYPVECADFVEQLQREHGKAMNGDYDQYVFTTYDRASLADFKARYETGREYSISEIGFEDYFLLFELTHNKLGIQNPERFNSRGVLRRMFLDSVFNGGDIETYHESFPPRFVDWLNEHETLFTTNYDSNIGAVANNDVFHLHGSFRVLSESYDPDSFRNQLEDDLLDGEVMDENYPHLYSTCLVSYVGDLKSFSMDQAALANSAMQKFVDGYSTDPDIKKHVDEMDESNVLVKRLKEAIKRKVENPDLEHGEQYPHDRLKKITGQLSILGLSPYNDGHLFTQILENDQIDEIVFYYFGKTEADDAARRFENKTLVLKDVREFWAEMTA